MNRAATATQYTITSTYDAGTGTPSSYTYTMLVLTRRPLLGGNPEHSAVYRPDQRLLNDERPRDIHSRSHRVQKCTGL